MASIWITLSSYQLLIRFWANLYLLETLENWMLWGIFKAFKRLTLAKIGQKHVFGFLLSLWWGKTLQLGHWFKYIYRKLYLNSIFCQIKRHFTGHWHPWMGLLLPLFLSPGCFFCFRIWYSSESYLCFAQRTLRCYFSLTLFDFVPTRVFPTYIGHCCR